jgi:hypothetical protein
MASEGVLTHNECLAILLSNAISIEDFLFPQIAITSSSDKYLLFSRLCKHYFTEGRLRGLLVVCNPSMNEL